MQTINMVGNFELPGIDFGGDPATNEEGKGGVGGALFVRQLTNKTHAIVADGAEIYSGADGGFNVKADEAIFPSTSASPAPTPARAPSTAR